MRRVRIGPGLAALLADDPGVRAALQEEAARIRARAASPSYKEEGDALAEEVRRRARQRVPTERPGPIRVTSERADQPRAIEQ